MHRIICLCFPFYLKLIHRKIVSLEGLRMNLIINFIDYLTDVLKHRDPKDPR